MTTTPDDPPSPPFADPAGTWNRRFAEAGFLFGTAPNERLREHGGIWKAGAWCLASPTAKAATASGWPAAARVRVDAFDIAEVGVAKARQFAAGHGVAVNYQVADCDGF